MRKKSEIDILFLIEHIDREMETAQEIVTILREKHDLKCVIASAVYHPIIVALKTRPKIVITASTSFGVGSPGWLFHKSFKIPPVFINLNYEQFISSWKGKYKSAKHEVSLNNQIQFTWGNYFKDFLIETGTKKENVIVTGRPLFSLLKKKYYKKNFKEELAKEFNIKSSVKWNFIALTDGLAFVGEKKVINIVKSGAHEEGLRNHIAHVKGTIEKILEWVLLMEKESDEIFILRPHPSISVDQYKTLIEGVIGRIPNNLLLFKDYTAQKWMMSCERFFTNYSTLTMDARVLEKEFHIFQPLDKIKSEDYWWCNNGINVTTYDAFRDIILDNEQEEVLKYTSKKDILDYIDLSKDGIEETVKEVVKVLPKIQQYAAIDYLKFCRSLLASPKRLFGSLTRLFFMKLNLNPFSIIKKGIVVDYFDFKSVNQEK